MRDVRDSEVEAAVEPRVLVDACAQALAALGRGEASQAAKQVLPTGHGGFFLSLSAVVPALGWAVAKWASYTPTAPADARSTSTILASPADGGAPVAVFRGMAPTRLRTAAAAVAVVEAIGRPLTGETVGLVGFGPTNAAVAGMLADLHGIRSWRVLARSATTLARAHADLPGDVRAVADPAVLGDCALVVSATGATSPVADIASLRDDAAVLCLDGRAAWRVRDAVVLDDRAQPDRPSQVAQMLAGATPALAGRVLIDQAGSAVTDAALAAVVLGSRA